MRHGIRERLGIGWMARLHAVGVGSILWQFSDMLSAASCIPTATEEGVDWSFVVQD